MDKKLNILKVVNNEPKYWEFIRKLRNLNDVTIQMIQQDKISKFQQIYYMQKYGNHFKICLYKNKPVGYFRVIDNDISIAILPNYRKKGIALFMVNKLKKIDPKAFAKIKIENQASIKLFQKANYKLKYYIYELDEWDDE